MPDDLVSTYVRDGELAALDRVLDAMEPALVDYGRRARQ